MILVTRAYTIRTLSSVHRNIIRIIKKDRRVKRVRYTLHVLTHVKRARGPSRGLLRIGLAYLVNGKHGGVNGKTIPTLFRHVSHSGVSSQTI